MKNDYEVRAQKFIKQIFPYLMDCDDNEDRERAVTRFNMAHHRNVQFTHGQTRYALITSDYVIKVDYRETCWGNSEDEMALYSEAEHDGFDYMFAKITRFVYYGQSFYIMPRIYGIGRYRCWADNFMSNAERIWCDDHELTDLHSYNYGWKNGHIVLIDYAARY